METFAKLFERFLVFVYHCFDRIVIQGYLPLLTRPEHIVHFFRDVHGLYPITPQVLAKRTLQYRGWVEGYARNHKIPILKAEKGVRKQDLVRPPLERMERRGQHGVYGIFTSMEMGSTYHLEDAQVSHRRSGLPHHSPRPLTLPALLLLHPRSGDRPAGHVRGRLSSLSDH